MSRIALGGSPCAGVSIGSCCALSGGCMKRTPGFTDEEREQYWIKIINQARRDPRGVTAFLLEQGVEKNNYYQWFKTLRRSHPEWHDLSKDPNHRALKERSKVTLASHSSLVIMLFVNGPCVMRMFLLN
jgi:hypothetical protein